MNKVKTHTYTIEGIKRESPDVYTFRCSYGVEPMVFLPGQFVVAQRGNGKKASVTMSSPPSDRTGFNFTLKRTGEFGTDFCDKARPGDEITVTRPTGPFALDVSQRRPVCFIGRDYTVSAARSALLERRHRLQYGGERPRGKFFLIHELSSREEQIFAPDFKEESPGFFYIPTLATVDAQFIKENITQLSATEFYVCAEGVDAKRFKAVLQELGLEKELVHIERWS